MATFVARRWARSKKMASITWTGASSTHFNDAGNWSPALPTSGDDVIIAPASPVSIDSPVSFTINSLSTNANVTLTINASTTFTDTNGTNGAGNAGVINVANGAVLQT